MVFRAKNRGEIYTIENLLVERLGGGVARLNDYKERGCILGLTPIGCTIMNEMV